MAALLTVFANICRN